MPVRKPILLLLLLLTGLSVFSQYHNLSGKVMDSRKSATLPGAILTLNYKNMQQVSDENGNFLFDSLPAGTYQLKIMYAGMPTKAVTVTITEKIHNNLLVEMNPPCAYDKNRKNKTCPVCGRQDRVQRIVWGLPLKMDTVNYYYGGCEVSYCDPTWYCKRDQHLF